MMNNFTPRAQQVLALARKEADRFNHNYVGTEHLLLGLIKLGQGVAVNVLQKMGLDLETVRMEVEKQVGSGPETKMVGNIPYTPRVKKVLALAAKEANATGIVPAGLAWNRAFETGMADGNPYDGIAPGKVNLWTHDSYHASAFGYYLEALVVFGKVTGKDPLSLGDTETVAEDMGFSKSQTKALQQIAHDELAASR